MKNLLMIFFFASAFAVANANAQTCTPCPPECVMAPCASACKGSAAAVNVQPVGVASLASFSPEALTAACGSEKMSGKDMKACQAKCTGTTTSLIPGATTVSAQQACTPATATQVKTASLVAPACTSKPIKQ